MARRLSATMTMSASTAPARSRCWELGDSWLGDRAVTEALPSTQDGPLLARRAPLLRSDDGAPPVAGASSSSSAGTTTPRASCSARTRTSSSIPTTTRIARLPGAARLGHALLARIPSSCATTSRSIHPRAHRPEERGRVRESVWRVRSPGCRTPSSSARVVSVRTSSRPRGPRSVGPVVTACTPSAGAGSTHPTSRSVAAPRITAHRLRRNYDYRTVIGEVVADPSRADSFGIQNRSPAAWEATLPSGGDPHDRTRQEHSNPARDRDRPPSGRAILS